MAFIFSLKSDRVEATPSSRAVVPSCLKWTSLRKSFKPFVIFFSTASDAFFCPIWPSRSCLNIILTSSSSSFFCFVIPSLPLNSWSAKLWSWSWWVMFDRACSSCPSGGSRCGGMSMPPSPPCPSPGRSSRGGM